MKPLDIFLAVIGDGLVLVLLVLIVRRRLYREYPFFFAYLVVALLSAISLLPFKGNDRAYAHLYWLLDGLNAVVVLFVLNEAFYEVFYRFYFFWWFRLIFPLVIVVAGLFAVQNAFTHSASPQLLVSMSFSATAAVSLIQFSIFLIMMLLVLGLHVRCRRYPYYIALGFAISGIGDWAAYALPCRSSLILQYVPPLTYLCATLIWLWSFSGKFVSEPRLEFSRPRHRRNPFDAGPTPKLDRTTGYAPDPRDP